MELLTYFTPVLLVIAYELPGMSGMELYDLLAVQEQLQAIPTLILTSGDPRQEEEIRKRGLRSLRKPIDPDELIANIQHLVDCP
jgi:CheY-like chemotaxis protein